MQLHLKMNNCKVHTLDGDTCTYNHDTTRLQLHLSHQQMGGVMFLKSGPWELVTKAKNAIPDLSIFFYSWEYDSDDHVFDWIFSSTPDIPVEGGEGGREKEKG